jgi:hypothetical protein
VIVGLGEGVIRLLCAIGLFQLMQGVQASGGVNPLWVPPSGDSHPRSPCYVTLILR